MADSTYRDQLFDALASTQLVTGALIGALRKTVTGEKPTAEMEDLSLGLLNLMTLVDKIYERNLVDSPASKEIAARTRVAEKLLEEERRRL